MKLQQNIKWLYVLIAIVFLSLGVATTDIYFSAAWYWCAGSFFVVSLAYFLNKPTIFRKRSDGTIPYSIRWIFWPFLWITQFYNSIARYYDSTPAIQEIEPGLFLARRLFPSDLHSLKHNNICAVLDVTTEFNSLNWTLVGEEIDYLNVPVLDHSVPSLVQTQRALNWMHTHRKGDRSVIVHCALGRGRSVFLMAAYLLSQYPEKTPLGVLKQIKCIRQSANLNKRQLKALTRMYHDKQLVVKNSAWLIANPVAGTRQWEQSKQHILDTLGPYYNLTIRTTSPDHNGAYWAKKALKHEPDMVIACGGDGTVAEVAQELVHSQVRLGIIPLGTANALSYSLCGLAVKFNPIDTACLTIIEGIEHRIDTARCNDETMLLLCGVGYEEQMIEKADRSKKNASGQLAYLQGLSEAVSDNVTRTYSICINDEDPFEINTPSLTIANAAPMTTLLAQGGGAPDSSDGLLDLTWLTPERSQLFNLMELIGHGFKSRISQHDHEGVHHHTAYRVTLSAEGKLPYVLDGEMREADQVTVEVIPKSLSVMVPAKLEMALEGAEEESRQTDTSSS